MLWRRRSDVVFKEIGELRDIRHFSKVILPISLSFFIYTFGWGAMAPVFSIYVNGITKSAFLTGLILSITTMAGVFLNIPFGIIAEKINMKRVLQATLLFYSALALLYPYANGFVPLLLLSVGRGIASSFLWLTSWAYIFVFTEKAVKGKETSFFSDMNDLASAVSPIIGGVLAALAFFAPFYLLSLTSFFAFIIVSVRLKESPKMHGTPLKRQMSKLAAYLRDSKFRKTVLLIVIFYALVNVYYSFLSVFLNGRGVSIQLIGVILTVALIPAVILEVPIGHLIDKHGIRKTLSAAVLLTTISALMIPISGDVYSMSVAIIGFTVSYTAIFIALYSRMFDSMRKDKVVITGAIATFKDLGYTVGPLLAGILISVVGIGSTFLITGGAFVLLLPIALSLRD
jgi:MFS family permease